jgi:hypothetical protein
MDARLDRGRPHGAYDSTMLQRLGVDHRIRPEAMKLFGFICIELGETLIVVEKSRSPGDSPRRIATSI